MNDLPTILKPPRYLISSENSDNVCLISEFVSCNEAGTSGDCYACFQPTESLSAEEFVGVLPGDFVGFVLGGGDLAGVF